MYYHAAILLLFRPFLKAKFTQSAVSPSDTCRYSAAQISIIFNQHRRMYGDVGIYALQIHCLLAACTIHVINIPAIASTDFFTSAANHFHQLADINGWALECIKVLKELIQRWHIVLPMDAEQALYQDASEGPGFGEADSNPGKRSAFSDPSAPPPPQQKKPKLSVPQMLSHPNSPRAAGRESSSTDRGTAVGNIESRRRQPATRAEQSVEVTTGLPMQLNYLAPFPNQPIPMLRPTHTSDPQNLSHMLQQPLVDFDGLTFESGMDWMDPFMGYHATNSYGEDESRA